MRDYTAAFNEAGPTPRDLDLTCPAAWGASDLEQLRNLNQRSSHRLQRLL